MSTNFIALVAELKVIKQWLKKTVGFSETTEMKSQSKSFLKVLDVSYWNFNTSLLITFIQIVATLSSFPFFKSITLAFMLYIMKAFLSSDMLVIWINIQNSKKSFKNKTFINHLFNFG